MSEELTIREGHTYQHDEHGQVEVVNIRQETLAVAVERNEDRTTTAIDPKTLVYVAYEYDNGIRRDEASLEDFQHKLSADQ